MQRGDLWGTLAFLNKRLAAGEPDFDALCYCFDILIALHDYSGIAVMLENASKIYFEPEQMAALAGYKGLLEGDASIAIEAFRIALALNPALEVFTQLAMASMPGPYYSDHLHHLHDLLSPCTYLEIGIYTGNTLRLAGAETHVIGIDPFPRFSGKCPPNINIYSVPSNEFFNEIAPTALREFAPISLAFIDGLHLFEQVLLDFIHVEAYCDPDGVVVLHDTLPVAELPTARDRSSSYWCGDVWKIVPCLEYFRPDLHIFTLPTFPSGLTIITGLDPTNLILRESLDQAVQQFANRAFSDCADRLASIKSTVKNELLSTTRVINQIMKPKKSVDHDSPSLG
jgi:hypothetical protein